MGGVSTTWCFCKKKVEKCAQGRINPKKMAVRVPREAREKRKKTDVAFRGPRELAQRGKARKKELLR